MNQGTYSEDLRKKVIQYIKRGGSKREACKVFHIGHDTVYRWIRLFKQEGHVQAKRRTDFFRKISEKDLKKYIQIHCDATLKEIGEHFGVSHVAIWKALQRMQYTRKKKSQVQGAK